jgi:hypothetical protein
MHARTLLALATLCLAESIATAQERPAAPLKIVRKFAADTADPSLDTKRFLLSPEVVADPDGTIHLAHSVLVADETGATDFRQSETLTGRVLAKKVFVLDSADVARAELLVYGSAGRVLVNGKAIDKSEPVASSGWMRGVVPPNLLKVGENEVVLSVGSLLIEPGRKPGRSFKSSDGGRTWSDHTLGARDNQQGEYLVRLRLGRYAPHGWAMSPVVDLWETTAGDVPVPGQLVAVTNFAHLARSIPKGTALAATVRTGSTPAPDAKTWTEWIDITADDYRPVAAHARHRWVQLRFTLTTTEPQGTPQVPSIAFAYELQRDEAVPAKDKLTARVTGPVTRLGSVPFVYEEPTARLKLLRERYQLDKVIAPGKTEMEQLMLLRYWVRNQWHTAWGSHPASWMPPWDALVILESKDQPDCLTMCTHYAAVFTQCCLALGWNARHCILDHHCVSEVWVDQHAKWVMMDAGNSSQRADVGLHFTNKDGVPLSALELHEAERSGKTKGIQVVFTPVTLAANIAALCRPAPQKEAKPLPRPDTIPLAELPKFPVCQLNNFRRYAFPPRNNYLTSLLPGELYQGWSHYFYDGYCWVGDTPDQPKLSPEYSWHLTPSRPQDIDWSVNWSRLHLSRTRTPGELQVDVETFTPNLLRLEKRTEAGDGPWQVTAAGSLWKLKPGTNVLRVRGVNHWNRVGQEARVEVNWKP